MEYPPQQAYLAILKIACFVGKPAEIFGVKIINCHSIRCAEEELRVKPADKGDRDFN